MAKQSRIERARCEGIVVDAEPVDEAFRVPSLWLLDDMRLNARRIIPHGRENDPRIRIGGQSANLPDGRATTEDDGTDFAKCGRGEDSNLDGAAVVLEVFMIASTFRLVGVTGSGDQATVTEYLNTGTFAKRGPVSMKRSSRPIRNCSGRSSILATSIRRALDERTPECALTQPLELISTSLTKNE